MSEYRRSKIAGGTFFFTVVSYNRKSIFVSDTVRKLLHSAWVNTQQRLPFSADAICLLRDHLHSIWRLPEEEIDYPIEESTRLEADFDALFATRTGHDKLDKRIAKTQVKKASLLLVLKHPELPLHNNPAELGARQRVRKRDVSFGPRTQEGRKAWDAFMTLAETTKKLKVDFYAYVRDCIT